MPDRPRHTVRRPRPGRIGRKQSHMSTTGDSTHVGVLPLPAPATGAAFDPAPTGRAPYVDRP